jgi:predicted amidohydrolase
MKIAVHQMCSGIDPESNVEQMIHAIGKAAVGNARFYFAPEMSVMVDRNRASGPYRVVAGTA